MGTGDAQGVKRPGRDPDLPPSPSAHEGTIPLLPPICSDCFQSTALPSF